MKEALKVLEELEAHATANPFPFGWEIRMHNKPMVASEGRVISSQVSIELWNKFNHGELVFDDEGSVIGFNPSEAVPWRIANQIMEILGLES